MCKQHCELALTKRSKVHCHFSTADEDDLKWGQVCNEKTDTYNLSSRESKALLLSVAGRQNGSFQRTHLLAEVT